MSNFILFFDSDCLMCNSFIKFVHKMDKAGNIHYSDFHSQIALDLDITIADNSMVFYSNGNKYYRSSALIEILKQTNFPLLFIAMIEIIPLNIRDTIYTFIANNRYRLNSKKVNQYCSLEINSKILK